MSQKNQEQLIQNLEYTVSVMERENASKILNMNVSRTRECIAILKDLDVENYNIINLLRELMICKKDNVLTPKEEQEKTGDIICLVKEELRNIKRSLKAA